MDDHSKDFLRTMLSTPGVSGFEQSIQAVVRDYVSSFADDVTTDLHGNVIAMANPGDGPRLMFDGHCDQLGMLVSLPPGSS